MAVQGNARRASARGFRAIASFDASAATIERALPGVTAMSSGFASVRDGDGVCALHDRYLRATSSCASHRAIPSLGCSRSS